MKNFILKQCIQLKCFVFSTLVVIAFCLQSCDTEIPPTDTDPPTFSFMITGDGFEHTFTQDDDFENFELYVKSNTNYHFLFTAADSGGLRTMEWDIEPKKLFELITMFINGLRFLLSMEVGIKPVKSNRLLVSVSRNPRNFILDARWQTTKNQI